MEIQSVQKARQELSVIKEPEQRVEGLKNLFLPLFSWHKKALQELSEEHSAVDPLLELEVSKDSYAMLPAIDAKLKELTSKSNIVQKERKDFTAAFDTIKERMSVPEKGYLEMKAPLEEKYKAIKRLQEQDRQKELARQQDLSLFRTRMQTNYNQQWSGFLTKIQTIVTAQYKKALETITPDEAVDFIKSVKEQYPLEYFCYEMPLLSPIENQDADKLGIGKEIFQTWDEEVLYKKFRDEIISTFSDFDVAYRQKEDALRQRQEVASAIVEEVKEDLAIQNEVVIIEEKAKAETPVSASNPDLFGGSRDLKKVWKINMEDNQQNMFFILAAFFTHRKDLLPKITSKKYFNISATNIIGYLEKVKNENNSFSPANITFVEDDKL